MAPNIWALPVLTYWSSLSAEWWALCQPALGSGCSSTPLKSAASSLWASTAALASFSERLQPSTIWDVVPWLAPRCTTWFRTASGTAAEQFRWSPLYLQTDALKTAWANGPARSKLMVLSIRSDSAQCVNKRKHKYCTDILTFFSIYKNVCSQHSLHWAPNVYLSQSKKPFALKACKNKNVSCRWMSSSG